MLPIIVVLIAAPLPTLEMVTAAMSKFQAFSVVEGDERPIRVGDVLASGRLVGTGEDQFCEMPDTTYGMTGSGAGQAAISLQLTSDCTLIVSSIDSNMSAEKPLGSTSDTMKSYPDDPSDPQYVRTSETRGPDETKGQDH